MVVVVAINSSIVHGLLFNSHRWCIFCMRVKLDNDSCRKSTNKVHDEDGDDNESHVDLSAILFLLSCNVLDKNYYCKKMFDDSYLEIMPVKTLLGLYHTYINTVPPLDNASSENISGLLNPYHFWFDFLFLLALLT